MAGIVGAGGDALPLADFGYGTQPDMSPTGLAEIAASAVRVRVIVDSVSADGKQVSVTTPRGVTRTIDITDPKMIAFVKTLKPGEPVNAVFAEAFSLKVLSPNASTVAPPVRAAK
jgi:hypothetical protein